MFRRSREVIGACALSACLASAAHAALVFNASTESGGNLSTSEGDVPVLAGVLPTVLDLTAAGSGGTINGAQFNQGLDQSFGSGVINSFLRVQNNDNEQGYNTGGGTPFNNVGGISFNNGDVSINDLAGSVITVGGTPHYRLVLDINEPGGGGQNLVSLDRLHIYTSPVHNQLTETFDGAGNLVFPSGAVKRFDMDGPGLADNAVLLDFETNNGGSGQADMSVLIPVSLLAGAAGTDAFYLYNRFGDTNPSGDGFEEWGFFTIIPEPAAGAMFALAALGIMRRARR